MRQLSPAGQVPDNYVPGQVGTGRLGTAPVTQTKWNLSQIA